MEEGTDKLAKIRGVEWLVELEPTADICKLIGYKLPKPIGPLLQNLTVIDGLDPEGLYGFLSAVLQTMGEWSCRGFRAATFCQLFFLVVVNSFWTV